MKKADIFKAEGRYTFFIPVDEGFQVIIKKINSEDYCLKIGSMNEHNMISRYIMQF